MKIKSPLWSDLAQVVADNDLPVARIEKDAAVVPRAPETSEPPAPRPAALSEEVLDDGCTIIRDRPDL